MAHFRKINAKRIKRFLYVVEETGTIADAVRDSGITSKAWYKYRERDEKFNLDLITAKQKGVDELIKEARRRAYEGVDEPVYYRGEKCGTMRITAEAGAGSIPEQDYHQE